VAKKSRPSQKAATPVSGAARAGGKPKGRGVREPKPGRDLRVMLEWAAGVLAALIVVSISVGYDSRVYGLYFTPRMVFFFVFGAAFLLVSVLLLAPGIRSFRADWLDALAGAFVLWQVVSAVAAPVRNIAWFGTYNRTGGAFMWIVLGLAVILARRTLSSRRGLSLLVWAAFLALFVNALTSSIQALGGTIPWGGVDLVNGRMSGTTGNPVNMAGLCLLSIWLGGLALLRDDLPRWTRAAAAAGAATGLVPIVLAVSRAAYLGIGVGAVVLGVVLLLRRRWKAAVVLGVALVLLVAGTFAYSTSAQRIGGALSGGGESVQPTAIAGFSLSVGDQQRLEFWQIALRATRTRPVFGYGPGAYAVAFREFVSPARLQEIPNMVVSDPHDLPLLLSSSEGIPGLLLGMGLLCAMVTVVGVRVLGRLRRPRGEEGEGFAAALGASAYGIAILTFLLVSPTDLVTLCPLALVVGAALGEPAADSRLSLDVRPFTRRPVLGRLATGAAGIIGLAFLIAALVLGTRLYAADIASVKASRNFDQQQALRAAELFPWYPHYAQIAGSLVWRNALSENRPAAEAERGQQLIVSSISYDPGQVLARADIARFYLATKRPALAVAQLQQGLKWCPNSPTLQGLYAYSSYVATKEVGDVTLGVSIREGFEARPPTVADGWYWLYMALDTEGDASAAAVALQKANALAPNLTPDDYTRRLQGG
jgi:O-antigen ligase